MSGRNVGDAEIGHLHPAVRREQDVAGLDVAVDEPPGMRRRESVGHLLADARHGGRGQRAVLAERHGEVAVTCSMTM